MRGFEILDSGETLYVEESGSGPPLVCVHGLGGGAYLFAGVAEALKHRNRVISFDLPGSGLSPRGVDPFSLERAAEIIAEVAAKRAGAPYTLLSHGFGTMLALKATSLVPDFVQKIISVSGLPEPLAVTQARMRKRALRVRTSGMLGIADSMLPLLFSEASVHASPALMAMFRRLFEMNDAATFAEMSDVFASSSAVADAHALRIPYFAIAGEDDALAPPPDVDVFLSSLKIPHKLRILKACSHLPFFEAPKELHRAIEDYLDA